MKLQKIAPCLWFDTQAEAAAWFYTAIFPNSRLGKVSWYDKQIAARLGRPEGLAMTVEFTLNGQPFTGLNGGPQFKFNEAVSFQICCDTQEELDEYWEKLGQGGNPAAQQCGWLKDQYGLSWQVVPAMLSKLLADSDAEQSARVMGALMQMKKLEIAELQRAWRG